MQWLGSFRVRKTTANHLFLIPCHKFSIKIHQTVKIIPFLVGCSAEQILGKRSTRFSSTKKHQGLRAGVYHTVKININKLRTGLKCSFYGSDFFRPCLLLLGWEGIGAKTFVHEKLRHDFKFRRWMNAGLSPTKYRRQEKKKS